MVEPTERDILCGIKAATKPGNQKLREWCLRCKGKYEKKELKSRVVDDIYANCCNKGMRFLKKHDNSWHELSKKKARAKISNMIRSFDKKSTGSRSEARMKPGKHDSAIYSKPDGSIPIHKKHDKSPSMLVDVAAKKRLAENASDQREDARLVKKPPKTETLKGLPGMESCEEKCVDPFNEALTNVRKLHRREVQEIRAELLAENDDLKAQLERSAETICALKKAYGEMKKQLDESDATIDLLKFMLRENHRVYMMKMALKEDKTENGKFRWAAASSLFQEKNLIDKMEEGCGMEAHHI